MTDWIEIHFKNKNSTHAQAEKMQIHALHHSYRDEKAGDYIIPFSIEEHKNLFYIGLTSRKFKERLKEHISDIKFNKSSTALSRMHQKENIKINFDKAKMIVSTSNHYSSIIRESIEILLRSNNVCKDVLSYNIPEIRYNILNISRHSDNMNRAFHPSAEK